MKKLFKLALLYVTLLSASTTQQAFASGVHNDNMKDVKTSNAEKYTSKELVKTFKVELNGDDYILAIGSTDFFSLVPQAKAKEMNMSPDKVYEAYFIKESYTIFSVVEWKSDKDLSSQKAKNLLTDNENFKQDYINYILQQEKNNDALWNLGVIPSKTTTI